MKLLTGKAAHKHMENFFPFNSNSVNIGGADNGRAGNDRATVKKRQKARRRREIAFESKRRNRRG